MMKKIKHYIKEIILFTIVMIVFANIVSYYKSMDLNKDALKTFSSYLIDKSYYTTPKNKAILVHIWATWCPVCKLESSNIDKISKKYEVITIAVNSGNNEDIAKYLKENNLNFKVINDKNGNFAKEFGVSVYPTSFIYDKNGNMVFSEVGYTSYVTLYIKMLWASLQD
jgi:thiol-disulfide isomerase/thioredoxin